MADGEPSQPRSPPRSLRVLSALNLGFFAGLSVVVGAYLAGDLSLLGDFSQAPYLIFGLVFGGLLLPILPALTMKRRPLYATVWALLGLVLTIAAAFWNFLDPVTTNPEFLVRGLVSAGLVLTTAALWSILYRAEWMPVHTTGRRLWLYSFVGTAVLVIVSSVIYIAESYAYFPETILLWEGIGAVLFILLFLSARRRPAGVEGTPREPVTSSSSGSTHNTARTSAILPALLVVILLASAGSPLVAGPTPTDSTPSGRSWQGSSTTATPIKHVIMMMLENHAFDNVFGVYPSDPLTASSGISANLTAPENLLSLPSMPSGLSAVPNGSFDAGGPIEGYSAYHLDVDGGKMDGFRQYSGPAAVTYLTSSQVAPEWDWAEEYGLADNYFAPMLTETNPNRLYSMCGFSPVINDYGPPPGIPYDQCIFSELSAYNVSYGYYVQDPSQGIGNLGYIQGITPQSHWIGTFSDFFSQLSSGSLPQVSWMEPVDGGSGASYDQLPDTLGGTMWLLKVVDSIMESPEWNSTAIFITYDEGGGFYDQVAPPTLDGEPLGQRVPLLVISPYSKEDYVSNSLLNHCSFLAFADYNWHLPALNGFVGASTVPLDFFDFGAAPRAPVDLTAAKGFPVPSSLPFDASNAHVASLSSLFPQPLQVPLSDLGYARSGSTNVTLQSLGAGVYVSSNFSDVAIYESPLTLIVVFDLELALIPFGMSRAVRRRPSRP